LSEGMPFPSMLFYAGKRGNVPNLGPMGKS
jgi:hypothetical protein